MQPMTSTYALTIWGRDLEPRCLLLSIKHTRGFSFYPLDQCLIKNFPFFFSAVVIFGPMVWYIRFSCSPWHHVPYWSMGLRFTSAPHLLPFLLCVCEGRRQPPVLTLSLPTWETWLKFLDPGVSRDQARLSQPLGESTRTEQLVFLSPLFE